MLLNQGDGVPQLFFDGGQLLQLAGVAEGQGDAVLSRPAGAADPVDVGLRNVREVVVDHAGEPLDVQAPGGDVGGHQHPDLPGLEAGQGGLAGGLGFVSVDGGGGDAGALQIPGYPVGPVLGAGED